jgi:outer membrane protein assembly factor BamB
MKYRNLFLLLTAMFTIMAGGEPLTIRTHLSAAQVLVGARNSTIEVISSDTGSDWPQLGHDSQRTNYTTEQIDPPYCYAWKWDEVPFASRVQPVVSSGRLFIGGMDGILYARNASTGAPLWQFTSQGPIRHSAAVIENTLIFSSHDGFTYALNVINGRLIWKTQTGASVTAPLIDSSRRWVYVASTAGNLFALHLSNGKPQWKYSSDAPILTTPALSRDNQTIFLGNEAIYAIAVKASTGAEVWRTRLQGQSLADRYPVVSGDTVIYRSQPLNHFHLLLHEGDDIMDSAGPVLADWSADWSKVRVKIISYLNQQPSKQTFFVLNQNNGSLKGTAPVLYTFGLNDVPTTPVVNLKDETFLTYRARHGIQTDSETVHVTSLYDAELGKINLSTLDISGLRANESLNGQPEFRMTSDESAILSMGGEILWVDNWERLGGINVKTGDLIHVGGVSNDWPECFGQCSPGTSNPFFPLSGSGAAYPFPNPRVTEGGLRGGAVIANKMIYWRVIEAGLAGISHRSGSACPSPIVWASSSTSNPSPKLSPTAKKLPTVARPLAEYVTLDLTSPATNPDPELVDQLRKQISATIETGSHLMPFYLERGFSTPFLWPYNTTNPPGPPAVQYINSGNVFWQDPGELLYSLALSYPYLDTALKTKVKSYLTSEMNRYPPLGNLPWSSSPAPAWLVQGTSRETYAVPFRSSLNSWPPPAPNLSAIYGLWLWSKNTGDWSYAQSHWPEVKNLFEARRGSILYYADIAGAIGYARLASHFGYSADYQAGRDTAVAAMQAGLDFDTFQQRAASQYTDPNEDSTGWSVPVFFGLTPEVGLYMKEQLSGQPADLLNQRENINDGVRWWYLTRVGAHGEGGETSYLLPSTAWSHFLAHAYMIGENRASLKKWLDRPWGRGDLYSIQKLVSVIQAPP